MSPPADTTRHSDAGSVSSPTKAGAPEGVPAGGREVFRTGRTGARAGPGAGAEPRGVRPRGP
ncbi:hypothetical protein ACFXP3_31045, partial [Streptomyces sp. NPDC059096]|uniref:hypothetical protein n=1 Tax=Streptomyces sp. NPDC059096 TaxID=3346727 RepID=UPI0036808B7A